MPRPFTLAALRRLAPVLTAALLAATAAPASAALYGFSGTLDSGSLAGTGFSGRFSFADPLPGFDGEVLLDSFTLELAGQRYTLAGADAAPVPAALFAAGGFLGVQFADTASADPATRPLVQLVAGFSAADQAFLAYDTTGGGVEGFGSLVLRAVPEPGTGALLLAGAGLLGAVRRQQQRRAGGARRSPGDAPPGQPAGAFSLLLPDGAMSATDRNAP